VVLGTGFSFLATIVVSRSLERSAYGSVLLAVTVVGSVATFLDFSFEEALVHFGARCEAAGDIGGLRRLIRRSASLDLGIGMLVFGVVMIGAGFLSQLSSRGEVNPWYFRIAAFEVLVLTLNGTTGATLMLAGRAEARGWAIMLSGGARLLAVFIAVEVFGSSAAILWAYVLSSLLGASAQGVMSLRTARSKWPAPPGELPVPPRRLIFFSLQSSITTTLIALEAVIVASLLGRNQGAAEVATFQVALFPVTLAALITAPMRMTSMSEQAALAARGHGELLWQGVRSYIKVALPVGVVSAVAGWYALGYLIPRLFSDRYEVSVAPARILLVAAVALLTTAWAKQLPMAIGKPGLRTWLSLADLIFTSILVFALVGRGAVGAAIGVSLVSATLALLWVLIARRMLQSLSQPLSPPED
jgi:O-antigen/teichoic acid export membrane protein